MKFFFLRTTTVKLQGRLEGNAFLGGRGFSVRLLGGVEGVDVSLMVLLVMKLHDLTRDVRLEGIVRVRQGGEGVLAGRRHVVALRWGGKGKDDDDNGPFSIYSDDASMTPVACDLTHPRLLSSHPNIVRVSAAPHQTRLNPC